MSNALKLASAVGGAAAPLYVDDVFSTYLYTGNGSTQTITNGIDLAGKGGMVWVKNRDATNIHNLWDSARGLSAFLESSSTAAQVTQGATSFSSTGFTFGTGGSVNNSGGLNYTSWTFRKAPKFFDVVTYTGDGAVSKNIPHSLGIKPGMIVVKRTDTLLDWRVYHQSMGYTQYGALNSLSAFGVDDRLWVQEPTATTFKVGNVELNTAGGSYVAYLFAHDPSADGIIQCGSFTTDGSGNATVNLGWEPQYVLFKNSQNIGAWQICDTSRGMSNTKESTLSANNNNAELSWGQIGIMPTATGFNVGPSFAGNSNTHVYLAIRRSNKPPTSGTQVYNAIARTGTGAAATVTGVGFSPDLVIGGAITYGKVRSLTDRLRGRSANWSWNYISAESTSSSTQDIVSFNMDGVTFGLPSLTSSNIGGHNEINHFFKRAPGVFDIVVSPINTSMSHNLGVTPELIIGIRRASNTYDTYAYVRYLGSNQYLAIRSTSKAFNAGSSVWTNLTPTTFGGSAAYFGTLDLFYLFASKAGISKVSHYIGNGSSQTINCGFTTGARFILIKRTDDVGDWYVWDTARGIAAGNDPHLSLNTLAAEVTTDDSIGPDSSGFIVNQLAATNINVTSASYIYLAIA